MDHPEYDPIIQFFEFSHLPPPLAEVSQYFHTLAHIIQTTLPNNPEHAMALRKLLEAKDAAVRAKLYREGKH